jgi:hypothetical protein
MDLQDFFSDEVPHEAATLIEQFELTVEELRQTAALQTARIHQEVNEQIAELQARANQQVADLEQQSEERMRTLLSELLTTLKPLQNKYLRAGKLDEALAVRERVRQLRPCTGEVRTDSGYLQVREEDKGKSFYYEVTGSTQGSVYGTDTYTTDTPLAATVVHAGILQPGQKGIVRVTFLKDNQANFKGSQRNGITSYDWSSSYPAFRVAKVR